MQTTALFTNDAIVFGLLMGVLGFIFYTQNSRNTFWVRFYRYVPALLLCYFIPGLLNSIGVINGQESKLYFVASRYLLPACLILLTLSVDLKAIMKLGPKALIIFLTGTVGIIIGGPIALLVTKYVFPQAAGDLSSDELWRGMTTVAGSWIGGGANQAAMKEVFMVSDKSFSVMVVIDIIVASAWMAVLLYLSPKAEMIDKKIGADASALNDLKIKMEKFQLSVTKNPTFSDLIILLAVCFSLTGLSHGLSDLIAPAINTYAPELAKFSLTSSFFWLIFIATGFGVLLSFTKAKNLEGVGASKVGNVFLYILVATIGMQMDIAAIIKTPGLFLIGIIWMLVHAILLIVVGKLIKAPFFFIAVGSQANVGGAASAPVVASVFHPSLAPVGVLLAVLGYVLGTYGAWICGQILQWLAI